jgi:Flp pilus assembly protein TadG
MFRVSTLGRFALDGGRAQCPAPPSGGRSTTTALSRFSRDERGQVALTFGLLTIIMATFIGAAVDMGRWMQARKATQEAMDSAVLAGLKKYQDVSTASDAVAQAVAAAMANYRYNIAGRTPICAGCDTISFVLTNSNTSMESTGNVIFQMPFLGLVNMPTLPLLQRGPTQPGAEFSAERSVSKTAVGANTGTSLEISVMIDITGSMGGSDNAGSTKIETVKTAAKNLIDIVVWADQTQYTSKVAVVPFSETVIWALRHSPTAPAARSPGARPARRSARSTTRSRRAPTGASRPTPRSAPRPSA